MEISAPNPTVPYKKFTNLSPTPPIRINFPLYKPEYKPPNPARTNRSRRKPITNPSDVLQLMDALKLPVPFDIYTSLIKECTNLGDLMQAVELHRHIRKSGLRLDLPLLNRVLLMYASSGCLEHARQVFDQMLVRDFNSLAVMIAACVENGEYYEAVKLFVKMLSEMEFEDFGDFKVEFTVAGMLVCVLKACLYESDMDVGKQVHAWLWKMGYSENVVLSSFLISFYGKLKCFNGAESVFGHGRGGGNTAVWTSRIVNFCIDCDYEGVIRVFKEMGEEGVRRNGYTFSTVLKACRRVGDVGCGRQIHASVMKLGLESNGFVQCALVDLYGKCGCLSDATRVFEIGGGMRNVACCNAMLASYVQHGLCIEAIRILYEMKMAGLLPRESIVKELRSVCGGQSFCGKHG